MLKDAYVTPTEADEFNSSTAWFDLDEDGKTLALQWGRVYLDGKYACAVVYESDPRYEDFSNALKVANARLGDYQAQGKLFIVSDTNDSVITAKSVKAGSVQISKKFATNEYGSSQRDAFPDVALILAPYCASSSQSFNQVPVIRS